MRFNTKLLLTAVLLFATFFAAMHATHCSLYRQIWEIESIVAVNRGGNWAAVDEATGNMAVGPCIDYYATCNNRGREVKVFIGSAEKLFRNPSPIRVGDRFWFAADRENPDTQQNPRFVNLPRVGILIESRGNGTSVPTKTAPKPPPMAVPDYQ